MSSISPSNNRDKLKLIGAQIFFRHGARTPFHLLPNLDEVIYDKELHLNHYKPADCEIKMLLKDNEETISERVFIGEHNIRKLSEGEGATFSGQLTAIAHNFPIPDELKELSKNFDEYSGEEYLLMGIHDQTSLTKELFVKTTIGFILNLIKENFDRLLQYDKDKNYYKFYVYATHDTSIASMKIAFDLFDKIWPEFASYILIKLYCSIDDPTKTFVHLTFNDKEQLIPWTNDYFCPYNIFIDYLKDQIDDRTIPVI